MVIIAHYAWIITLFHLILLIALTANTVAAVNTGSPVTNNKAITFSYANNIPTKIQQNSNINLRKSLEKYGETLSQEELDTLLHLTPEIVESAAKPFGFFHSQCQAKLDEKDHSKILLTCELGPPIIIDHISLTITGSGKNALHDDIIKKHLSFREGEIFEANKYERSKNELLSIAYDYGYLNANTSDSTLTINTDNNTAQATFTLDTHDVFIFGPITPNGDTYSKDFLRNLAEFKPGDNYQSKLLHDYQNTLQYTGLFTTVSIKPSLTQKNISHEVPIYLDYEPIQKVQYKLGVGYNTDTKLNTSLGFTRNRLGMRGEKLNAELHASSRRTSLQTNLYIPSSHPKFDYYSIEAEYANEMIIDDNNDQGFYLTLNHTKIRNFGASHFFDSQTSLIYTLDWSKADDGPTIRTQVVYPKIQYQYIFKSLDKTIQATLGTEISGNIEFFLSDISFLKTILYSNIRTAEIHNLRFIVKNKFGLIVSDDTLPLAWYFRTGGTYTVRGFEYESIGETELTDNKMLFTHTTEVQHKLIESFFLATFFDCGNVSENVFANPTSQAIGTGLVWESPFGDIEVSVAWPLENYSIDQDNYKFHIALKKGFY